MSVLSLLNKTCTIVRSTPATGSVMGSTTYSYTNIDGVACKVDVKIARQDNGMFRAGEEVYNFYFAFGTDVRSSDNITNVPGYSGYTFTARSNPIDDVGRGAYTRLVAQHVTGATKP